MTTFHLLCLKHDFDAMVCLQESDDSAAGNVSDLLDEALSDADDTMSEVSSIAPVAPATRAPVARESPSKAYKVQMRDKSSRSASRVSCVTSASSLN